LFHESGPRDEAEGRCPRTEEDAEKKATNARSSPRGGRSKEGSRKETSRVAVAFMLKGSGCGDTEAHLPHGPTDYEERGGPC